MSEFLRDVKIGMRQLASRPLFSAAAILSLALGTGLNTALFSIVNGVLLRNSPVADRQRLVEIYSTVTADFPQLTTSYPDYRSIRDEADVFSGVAAHAFARGILSGAERPELVTAEAVTSNYFAVLGLRPGSGRVFRADEDAPGAPPVVILSHGLWQRRFGARPDVVGQTLRLSGIEYTIVGIGPRDFPGTVPGIPADLWVPVAAVERLQFAGVQSVTDTDPGTTRLDRRGTRWLFVKGRLKDGRTIEQARAQLDTIFARLAKEFPATNEKTVTSIVPATSIRFHPMLDGYVRAASAVLLTAVGLVLLIACANVANLLLARGSARQRELAIRSAIGASRGRLIRQLLTEGLVLASLGGLAGTFLAWWAVRAVAGFGSDLFPMRVAFDFSLDPVVLLFAVGVTTASAVIFGLAPAWASSKPELVTDLKNARAAVRAGRRRFTLRDALVVTQLALSVVLLVAGALLARGLLTARGTDIGFDPSKIATLSFNLQMNGYTLEQSVAFRERALDALRQLPEVDVASIASRPPLAPDINVESVQIPGRHTANDDGTAVDTVTVGPDYFAVVGVAVVSGRAFTKEDVDAGHRVAIVNQTFARQFWPDGSAVGRTIYLSGFGKPGHEIVGISRDHKVRTIGEAPRPYLHLPAAPSRDIGLVVRTRTPAAAALPSLRAAVLKLEPTIVFTADATAAEVVALTTAPTRIGAVLMGAFGALALLLAAVGLYGVISYSVSLRTREVGIRMALGAERGQVLRLVLGQGGRLALVGVALGAAAAAGTGRVLESLLYGVSAFDPIAYVVAAGILLLVAALANVAPAIVAARVNPVTALRSE